MSKISQATFEEFGVKVFLKFGQWSWLCGRLRHFGRLRSERRPDGFEAYWCPLCRYVENRFPFVQGQQQQRP